jgi:hypothetical protein
MSLLVDAQLMRHCAAIVAGHLRSHHGEGEGKNDHVLPHYRNPT